MKRRFYFAWIPFLVSIAGIPVYFVSGLIGAVMVLTFPVLLLIAIAGRKTFGARCARCGRPIPSNSVFVDYCVKCGKKIRP